MLSKFQKLILLVVVLMSIIFNLAIAAGPKCSQYYCPNNAENCFGMCGNDQCIPCRQIKDNWCTSPGYQGDCCSSWRCYCEDEKGIAHRITHNCCESGCPIGT